MASYKVDATQAPVAFSVTVSDIKDSEGNDVPREEVSIIVTASGEVSATFDESSDSGEISFGAPGSGAVEYKVVDKDDPAEVLAVTTDGFSLVAGDPASVGSVVVSIPDLVPESEPTPQ